MSSSSGRLNSSAASSDLGLPDVLTQEQLDKLAEIFDTVSVSGGGHIEMSDLHQALDTVDIKLPRHEVREMVEKRFSGRDRMDFEQFAELYKEIQQKRDPGFGRSITGAEGLKSIGGEAQGTTEIYHSIRYEEQVAFSNWINANLCSDTDLNHLLKLKDNGEDLYEKVGDGLLICKLINSAVPETIDERALNKTRLNAYTKRENLTLAINSAMAIGCSVVNIDADDLAKGKAHLVLGLIWQIIRIGLFREISLKHVPGLYRIMRDGESMDDFRKLSPEQILIRWANYHLAQAGNKRRLNNFTTDVVDSEIYTVLMKQIAPKDRHVGMKPLDIKGDNVARAEAMLKEADKLDCRAFVTSEDVANGVYKLNLAFVANLFNTWPGLEPPEEEEMPLEEIPEETREEKTYRNWMNSMGVKPSVNYLYGDLQNGVVIFQLYDVIRPGMVNWKNVKIEFHKLRGMMDQIQNCNYAVVLGKQLKFSLVGIQGSDIHDGNQTLTLALVWQLMRAYTLTVLAQCTASGDQLATDKQIVNWVNQKLEEGAKSSVIKSFQDAKIGTALPVLDLIDALQPGTIRYELVKNGDTDEEKLENAKYAISMGRKVGARIYALPEDIVQVKPKMVMTVFACLMAHHYMPDMKEKVVDERADVLLGKGGVIQDMLQD